MQHLFIILFSDALTTQLSKSIFRLLLIGFSIMFTGSKVNKNQSLASPPNPNVEEKSRELNYNSVLKTTDS